MTSMSSGISTINVKSSPSRQSERYKYWMGMAFRKATFGLLVIQQDVGLEKKFWNKTKAVG